MRTAKIAIWREQIFVGILYLLPVAAIAAWGAVITFILLSFIPLWAALLIAAPVSLVVVVLLIMDHGNSLMEIAIGSFIALVMAAILWTAFANAKAHRLHTHPKAVAKMQGTLSTAGKVSPHAAAQS